MALSYEDAPVPCGSWIELHLDLGCSEDNGLDWLRLCAFSWYQSIQQPHVYGILFPTLLPTLFTRVSKVLQVI